MFIHSTTLSRKKLEKMPKSQKEWNRSRLDKTLLVKLNRDLIEKLYPWNELTYYNKNEGTERNNLSTEIATRPATTALKHPVEIL